jgi:MFS family permease
LGGPPQSPLKREFGTLVNSELPSKRILGGFRDMPRNVWILSGISFGVAIGFGVVVPVLPLFAASFGVNAGAVAAVVSAFALMRFVFAPVVGRLTDRWGHRLVLLAGVGIVAVSSLAVGFAQSYAQMIVLRGLGGIGSAMFTVSSMTILLGSVGPERRGRASAFYQGAFLIGVTAGPGLGGLFGAISLRAPFFFYAATLGCAALVALGLQPIAGGGEVRQSGGEVGKEGSEVRDGGEVRQGGDRTASAKPSQPWPQVLRDRRYQAALVAHLVQGWNANGTRAVLIPLFAAAYLADEASGAALGTGIALSVGAAVQMAAVWPSGLVVDRFGRRLPMIAGALVSGLTLALLPLSRSFAALALVLAAYALGSALMGTAPTALVGDSAGPGGTRAIAVYSMAGDLGSVVGPLAAGYLAGWLSYGAAFAVGAVMWVASAVLSAAMKRADRT